MLPVHRVLIFRRGLAYRALLFLATRIPSNSHRVYILRLTQAQISTLEAKKTK
jgi:hypothetical protein